VRDENARSQFVVQAAQPAPHSLRTIASSAPNARRATALSFDRERARQRDALTLTARQLIGKAISDQSSARASINRKLFSDLRFTRRSGRFFTAARTRYCRTRYGGETARMLKPRNRFRARAHARWFDPRHSIRRGRIGLFQPAIMRSSEVLRSPTDRERDQFTFGDFECHVVQRHEIAKFLLMLRLGYSFTLLWYSFYACARLCCRADPVLFPFEMLFNISVATASNASSEATANDARSVFVVENFHVQRQRVGEPAKCPTPPTRAIHHRARITENQP